MKKALLLLGLTFLSVTANASVEVDEVINSSCTFTVVTMSSTTPTRVDSDFLDLSSGTANNLMPFRKVIELQAQGGSNFRLDFSSNSLSATVGRVLVSSATVAYNIKARDGNNVRINLWGMADGAGGNRQLGVTQCGSK